MDILQLYVLQGRCDTSLPSIPSMHPRPPKSAPGRIRTRKTPVMKEIEEWVVGDGDMARDSVRHTSQVTENITEERLLRSKLIELGKERYKFLHKYASERQSFMDNQKKKFSMFKKKRVNTALPEVPINSEATQSIISTNLSGNQSSKPPPYNQRSVSAFTRPKTVKFQSNMSGGYLKTGVESNRPKTVPVNSINRVMITAIPESQTDSIYSIGNYNSAMSGTDITDGTSTWSRPSTGVTTTFGRSITSAESLNMSRSYKYGSKFPGLTNEPRFADLEKSLSLNYISHVKPDVKRIIERIESLRRPTKRIGTKEAKRELELKLREFMKENGIVF